MEIIIKVIFLTVLDMERDQSNIQMIAILRDNFEMIKSVVSVENITAMELSIMEISRTI
jgi:hypothetical protein